MKLFSFTVIALIFLASCQKNNQKSCTLSINTSNVQCNAQTFTASLNGFLVMNYPGTNDKLSEGNLVDGVPDGFWKFYHPNGNLSMDGNYTNGKLNGFWKVYYTNGYVRAEGNYSQCTKTGFWKYYYSQVNNTVHFEGNYQNGGFSGVWSEYDLSGQKTVEYSCP